MTEPSRSQEPFEDASTQRGAAPRRRAVPRQPADWFEFYKLDDTDNEPVRCCRVLDISPMSAGLELFATTSDENLNGLITVTVELHGNTGNVILDGETHTARVGIDFDVPSPKPSGSCAA